MYWSFRTSLSLSHVGLEPRTTRPRSHRVPEIYFFPGMSWRFFPSFALFPVLMVMKFDLGQSFMSFLLILEQALRSLVFSSLPLSLTHSIPPSLSLSLSLSLSFEDFLILDYLSLSLLPKVFLIEPSESSPFLHSQSPFCVCRAFPFSPSLAVNLTPL